MSSENGSFMIELCDDHRIFAAHFPEKPVLPGACIIEIFNHLINISQNCESRLEHIRQIKFLKMIDPTEVKRIRFSFDSIIREGDTLHTKSSVTSVDGTELFAKMSASYVTR